MIKYIFWHIKEHLLFSTTIFIVAFVLLFLIAFHYRVIIAFSGILYNAIKICFDIIIKPVNYIKTLLKFQIKKVYLACKLAIRLQIKNNSLLPNILLDIFLIFLLILTIIIALNLNTSDYKSIIYMVDGTLTSILVTHFVSIIVSINKTIENIENAYIAITDIKQLFITHYEIMIAFFPYDDTLFKEKNDIVYISPVFAGIDENYLNGSLATNFLNYFHNLTQDVLLPTFRADAVKIHIQQILKHQFSRQMFLENILNTREYISKELDSLFQQTISSINRIISFDIQYPNWNTDKELTPQISVLFGIYITKLINCILSAQKEFEEYSDYVKHVSKPPKFIEIKRLHDLIIVNAQIKTNNKNKQHIK